MLRSRSCPNCATGGAKCIYPGNCIFSVMPQSDYNAIRNHFGRDMFKRHMENIETIAPQERNRLQNALIGASKWWIEDPIEGTFGEINRRIHEEKLMSRILVELCGGICGTAENYEQAEALATQLPLDHPLRFAVAIAHSQHYSSSLDYERAIATAKRTMNIVRRPMMEEALHLHEVLCQKVAAWENEIRPPRRRRRRRRRNN